MPKSSQKAASADQPATQRGKSRFGTSGRPARVVLPERPPRAVDNEIVSILLGADPAALVTQAEEVKATVPAGPPEVSPSFIPVEASAPLTVIPTDRPPEVEPTTVSDLEATAKHAESIPVAYPIVEATELTADLVTPAKAAEAPLTPPREAVAPPPARARRASSAPAAQPNIEHSTPAVQELVIEDGVIPSFEEFVERWKHGLRKGQLKVCEALYQKTYAIGQTECVTSFAELGRLSGLKMRQCFNIIAQLEALRFVERSRSACTSNKKDQGSVIRFHLYPAQ